MGLVLRASRLLSEGLGRGVENYIGLRHLRRTCQTRIGRMCRGLLLLANTRQLLAKERIEYARASNLRLHQDHTRMLRDDFADYTSIGSQGVLAHPFKNRAGSISGDDRHQLAFVRDIEGIQAENLAGAADGI